MGTFFAEAVKYLKRQVAQASSPATTTAPIQHLWATHTHSNLPTRSLTSRTVKSGSGILEKEEHRHFMRRNNRVRPNNGGRGRPFFQESCLVLMLGVQNGITQREGHPPNRSAASSPQRQTRPSLSLTPELSTATEKRMDIHRPPATCPGKTEVCHQSWAFKRLLSFRVGSPLCGSSSRKYSP